MTDPRIDNPPTVCFYCEGEDRPIQLVAIAWPGHREVRNAWLHPDCEHGYLRMIGEPGQ